MEQLEEVRCTITVMKKLPTCEHSAQMMCSASPTAYACKSRCESLRPCCGKACTAACYECQSLSRQGEIAATMDVRAIPRIRHAAHPCEKTLYVRHRFTRVTSKVLSLGSADIVAATIAPWITSARNSAPRAAVKAVLTPLAVNHAQHHALYVDLCLARRVSDLTLLSTALLAALCLVSHRAIPAGPVI
jgi:hypothetical protein